LTYGEYLKQRREAGYSNPIFPRLRRVDRNIELVTELAQINKIDDATVKTERVGKWYEVVIHIDDDHVAYLTIDNDCFEVIQAVWLEAQG
jgi:hypothetical protein